ncbi:hypothetical protein BKA66DRAFT_416831 [Pyrenochaeta sp. MPI-SDFR-AT-0127]|nr:hypothetical protein BKA66DRAFT_416831 [Pyrenochaeta sp. MPI-SDFR-AT-0127]
MSTQQPARPYRQYPAYYFRASPTYDAWVKLTIADVQALRSEPEFQAQHIYFHLNHPIRFIRLVGVIVAIDDINAKYSAVTIDDGSGATIELKIDRIPAEDYNPVDSASNTVIDNVNIISQLGVFEVLVDRTRLDIGMVIKAKGIISVFRSTKQLDLKRIWIVTTTNEEAQTWAETAAFKQDILSAPWYLSSMERKKIKSKIKAEKRRLQDYERRRAEHEAKKIEQKEALEAHMARREAKLEMRRRKEEAMMNSGALK